MDKSEKDDLADSPVFSSLYGTEPEDEELYFVPFISFQCSGLRGLLFVVKIKLQYKRVYVEMDSTDNWWLGDKGT